MPSMNQTANTSRGLHEWAQGTAQRSGGEETFDPAHFNLDKVNDDRVIGPG